MFSYLSSCVVTPLNDEAMLRLVVHPCYRVQRRSRDTTRGACRQALILLSPCLLGPSGACMLPAPLRSSMRASSRLFCDSPPPLYFPPSHPQTPAYSLRSFLLVFLHLSSLSLSIDPAPFSQAKIPAHPSLAFSGTRSSSAMLRLKFTFLSCCGETIFLLPWGLLLSLACGAVNECHQNCVFYNFLSLSKGKIDCLFICCCSYDRTVSRMFTL